MDTWLPFMANWLPFMDTWLPFMARKRHDERTPTSAQGESSANHPGEDIAGDQTLVKIFPHAKNFDIHDGNIASIGGDSFNARGDVNITTINHYHSSSSPSQSPSPNPSPSLRTSGAHNNIDENQQREIEQMFPSIRRPHKSEVLVLPPLPIQRSCDIYRRHLATKGRGIPLWIPEPSTNLPIQYQRKGIAIGDVGIVTASGSFMFLFNICLPKDHPINPPIMPKGFEPLKKETMHMLSIYEQREFKENSYLSSASSVRVRGNGDSIGLIFESSGHDGAILTMPLGSNSFDLSNVAHFREYVTKNLKSWYHYAYHDFAFELQNGDLRVVTGCDKTTVWGMATFFNSGAGFSGPGSSSRSRVDSDPLSGGGEPKFHLEFGLIESGNSQSNSGEVTPKRYGWACSGMAEVRAGPDAREVLELRAGDVEEEGAVYENQCLFVRTLNATLSEKVWGELGIGTAEEEDMGYSHPKMDDHGPSFSSSSPSGRGGVAENNDAGPGSAQNFSLLVSNHQKSVSKPTTRKHRVRVQHDTAAYYSSSMSSAEHPSTAINELLLKNCSYDITMAITLDQDWMSVVRENDSVVPSSDELVERIMKTFDIREEDGIVFLDSKCGAVGSPASQSVMVPCPEEPPPTPPEFIDIENAQDAPSWMSASHNLDPVFSSADMDLHQDASSRSLLSMMSIPTPRIPNKMQAAPGTGRSLSQDTSLSKSHHAPRYQVYSMGMFPIGDLASLSGVPGLSAGVKVLTAMAQGIEQVKIYKLQCRDISGRCVCLMFALRDSSAGLEGTKAMEICDEIEVIVIRINRKVKEWASWNPLKSFLQKGDIEEGLERLHRDIDGAMVKFSKQMNMEINRNLMEAKAIQERDKAEIREVLQGIVNNTDDMKALLNMQTSSDLRPVEEVMKCLQTELMDPDLSPRQEEAFKAGLWELHEKTSKLPPLTDLSGQVTFNSQNAVAKGSFNDVYQGQWLDRETVALRLPRTISSSPEDQDRFQREVTIWRELTHPNVVPIYGVVYMDEDVYSVSPWMDNGTAVTYVKRYPQVDRIKLLVDAASGLEYLHKRNIVHGALRGSNVLISKDRVACLTDFGMSKFLEDSGKHTASTQSINPRWFAPELLHNVPASTHSDVWSFGMVCLEILSGDVPYSNLSLDIAVLRELDNGSLPQRPGQTATQQGLTDGMWELMQKCWQKQPQSRPSISSIKASLMEMNGSVPVNVRKPTLSNRFSRFTSPRNDSQPSNGRPNGIRPSIGHIEGSPSMGHINQRPSTSSGAMASQFPSRSNQRQPSLSSSQEAQDTDELSPLGITPDRSVFNKFESPYPRKNSTSSLSPSLGSNSTGLNINFETSPASPSLRTLPLSPRSGSRLVDASSSRLEIPIVSSFSLPAQNGSYFPVKERSLSREFSSTTTRSVLSTNSSLHITAPIREAVSDPRVIVNVENGIVISGTLEGLVERLTTNFNLRSDVEYRDVLLIACADFTTPEGLFAILSRRFYDAELREDDHPEDRVAVQYNIFMVITHWLSHQLLNIDDQLMWQMRTFCESAIRTKSSSTMVNKANDLLSLVMERARMERSPSILLSPGRKLLQTSQVKPQDLAIALTLLEGDKYKILTPSDYIAHLRMHPGYNNVEGAYTTNNKIILWVKDSILHYDSVQKRASVLGFFIHTAMECRKLRNFSSLVAIATAVHSAPIEQLRLTKRELTPLMQTRLTSLEDFSNPSANHRGYREALNEAGNAEERDQCVPWLAFHLKELHSILQRYPTTVQVDGRPLINFQRYLQFMACVREVIHYKPPDLERYRQHGQLDYLENQLKSLKLSANPDEELMERSNRYVARESVEIRTRKAQLRTLGFRTS